MEFLLLGSTLIAINNRYSSSSSINGGGSDNDRQQATCNSSSSTNNNNNNNYCNGDRISDGAIRLCIHLFHLRIGGTNCGRSVLHDVRVLVNGCRSIQKDVNLRLRWQQRTKCVAQQQQQQQKQQQQQQFLPLQ
ncbi:hypothetical protein ACLKA7_006362 [Drosophila subpalustris]